MNASSFRLYCLILLFALPHFHLAAQQGISGFRFAFVSDTHIGSPDGKAEEDLRRTVADINATPGIAFVVITGDITEMGTNEEIRRAKAILDSLQVPWYILPGNHDTGWSESGGLSFTRVFGYDKFSFEYGGIRFIGCASGPYVRMSDGHIPRDAVNWLDSTLGSIAAEQPLVFLNHYPADTSLDNWYEITDRLRQKNTLAILCGHGHSNRSLNFEDIPGIMSRSNLRAKAAHGGYNIVEVSADSMRFSERRPGTAFQKRWHAISLVHKKYSPTHTYARPSYDINRQYSEVYRLWTFSAPANIASTPAVSHGLAVVGSLDGTVYALNLNTGEKVWSFKTEGPVFSSPAISNNRVVLGSADGSVYCLNRQDGRIRWRVSAQAAVLGTPLIRGNLVYIGGSDNRLRCLRLSNGEVVWEYSGIRGPVVGRPVWSGDKIIFGAWDTYLYALDAATGKEIWKWSNGSAVRNLSPAACLPAVHRGVVYVVAPDRYITAIDESSGTTLWRSNESTVRESMGISRDGSVIYAKTMYDTVVAFYTGREKKPAAWKLNAGFGYEHVPSMLRERAGYIFFGTRHGVVYSINARKPAVAWAHKIDNSMVNTVQPLSRQRLLATTMDGKTVLLRRKG